MKDKIKICVTQEDIDNANKEVRENNFPPSTNCPISQANRREYKLGQGEVSTGISRTRIRFQSYSLSRAARRFIHNYDSKKPVKPFNFIATKV